MTDMERVYTRQDLTRLMRASLERLAPLGRDQSTQYRPGGYSGWDRVQIAHEGYAGANHNEGSPNQ